MLKIFLSLIAIFISVYWVGEKARKNQNVDAFLAALEENYSKINGKIEGTTTVMGLRCLRRFYGWVSVFLFACLFVSQSFLNIDPENYLLLFWIFGFAFIGWFSIKWVIDHNDAVREFSKNNALIISGPLLIGISDFIFNTFFTEILLLPFRQFAAALHFNMPEILNPIAVGGAVSLVIIVFYGFYYLLVWAVVSPVFFVSALAVVLPIKFARFLAQIDRSNTFFWFTVFVMIFISVWLTQL